MGKKNSHSKILLVTNNRNDERELRSCLENAHRNEYFLWHCFSLREAMGLLKNEKLRPNLIMLDLGLINSSNLREVYNEVKYAMYNTPIIVIASENERKLVTFAMKAGASDYVARGQFGKIEDAIELALIRHQALKKDQAQSSHILHASLTVEKIIHKKEIEKINEKIDQKEQEHKQIVSWLTGGYSVESDMEDEYFEDLPHKGA